MARKLCNFRAEDTLLSASKAKAESQGVSLTWVLERALSLYAAGQWQPPADSPEGVTGRLDSLEQRLEGLANRLGRVERIAEGSS